MNRVEILNKVKENIKEKGAIECLYINEAGCMCAVGYVFAECGVDMSIFPDEALNGEYANIVAERRSIAEQLEPYGFTGEELRELQKINDNWNDTLGEQDRIEALLDFIDEMIKSGEEK